MLLLIGLILIIIALLGFVGMTIRGVDFKVDSPEIVWWIFILLFFAGVACLAFEILSHFVTG